MTVSHRLIESALSHPSNDVWLTHLDLINLALHTTPARSRLGWMISYKSLYSVNLSVVLVPWSYWEMRERSETFRPNHNQKFEVVGLRKVPELHGEQDKHPQGSTLVPTAFPFKKREGPLSPLPGDKVALVSTEVSPWPFVHMRGRDT